MSVADWLEESKQYARREDTPTAIARSLESLWDGVGHRWQWLCHRILGMPAVRTTLAGESILHLIDSHQDLRRARTALKEHRVMKWLFEPVDDETIVWDVGGYHGTYAVVAAVKGATVLAFEPHTGNLEGLEQHAALNCVHVDTYDVALSDTARSAAFGTAGSKSKLFAGGDEMVETAPGDTISPPPDILKIDVEGHEAAVLRGLAGHLESVERVVVEVHDGVSRDAIATQLEAAGLTVVELATSRSESYLGGVRR